jgi:hypothetical protein
MLDHHPAWLAATLSTFTLFAPDLAAQQPKGSLYNVAPSIASRGSLLTNGGVLFNRFDFDDARGFGMTVASPGNVVVEGFVLSLQDYDGATAETYSVALYEEDPANQGLPLINTPVVTLGPFTSPIGVGPIAFNVGITFSPAVAVAANQDLFVGVVLGAAPAWPADGLAVQTSLGGQRLPLVWDSPGPAPIQHAGYGGRYDPTFGQLGYPATFTPRQYMLDLQTSTPGGTATAITNQASYPTSNLPPGTGSMFSAYHPDAQRPPVNLGRADDLGYVYLDTAMPTGTPVFFFADFGSFGPPVYLAPFVPGSVGVFCLNASAATLGLGFLVSGEAAWITLIPATARPTIAGLAFLQQGLSLDTVNGLLRAAPCTRTVL